MNDTSLSRISLLIPTKNGSGTLRELFASLTLQTVIPDEIIVADSGSEDDSVEIARSYGAEVIAIEPKMFDHGGTRTLLARAAKGPLLLFMTQDVVFKKRDAIEKLIQPLLKNNNVGASYGRQMPAFDAEHFAASLRLFNYSQEGYTYRYADREKFGIKVIFTSNSFACYSKEALAEVGYFRDGLIFGEDTLTVADMLRKGYSNCYVASAEVYHSHNYSLAEEFKRYFDIGVLHDREKLNLNDYGTAAGRGKKYILHELEYIRRSGKYFLLVELTGRICVKFSGYKLGRLHRLLPMKIIAACSMNSLWWQKEKTIER